MDTARTSRIQATRTLSEEKGMRYRNSGNIQYIWKKLDKCVCGSAFIKFLVIKLTFVRISIAKYGIIIIIIIGLTSSYGLTLS